MKQIFLFISVAVFSIFTITSCQKKDDTAPDANKVMITLSSPTDGQTISLGDTLHIAAQISYPSELHGYEITLTDSATGTVLFSDDEHVHDDHFTINENWLDTLTTAATLQLKITVEIDHNGNEATKTVMLKSTPAGTGSAMMRFTNTAGTQLLQLNTGSYTTVHGDQVTISKFNYYISNVRFNNANGSVYAESNSYHLVQQSDPASSSFNLANIPAGTYNSISFMIGVDSLHNVSGAQSGALDPTNGMFWDWNTGYIMAKMEGTSPQSAGTNNAFVYHIGGFSGANNSVHTVTLNLSTPLTITRNNQSVVNLHADALSWFGPNTIDLSTLYFIMNVSADSKKISDNYANMFGVDSLRN